MRRRARSRACAGDSFPRSSCRRSGFGCGSGRVRSIEVAEVLDEVLALVQGPLTFAVLAQSCSGLCWWRFVAVRILELWDRDAHGGPDSGGLVIGTQSGGIAARTITLATCRD